MPVFGLRISQRYTPCRGRVHVTSRSTIPIRFACVERRKTPVFVRFGVQKHVEFQVGLYCNTVTHIPAGF